MKPGTAAAADDDGQADDADGIPNLAWPRRRAVGATGTMRARASSA